MRQARAEGAGSRGRAWRGDDSTKSLPDEHDVMRELALAYVRLDQPAKAEERLSKLVAEAPTISIRCTGGRRSAPASGRKEDARADLARCNKAYLPVHSKVSLALVVAAELGEVLDGRVAALDVELAKHRDHDGVCFEAARAFALASKAVILRDQAPASSCGPALELLTEAVVRQDASFSRIDDDPAVRRDS